MKLKTRNRIAFVGTGIGLILYAAWCFYAGDRLFAAMYFATGIIEVVVFWFMGDRFYI